MQLTGTLFRMMVLRVIVQIAAVLLVIEAVFLAESLAGILEEVLKHQGNWLDAAGILALTAPEIFDFALPLALVIGVYTAFIAARESNELVVCSAAGLSWNSITAIVVALGLASFALSLMVAGYLNPLAATVKRAMLWDLQARLVLKRIIDPGERDALQTIDGWTFISTHAADGGRERGHLFVHHPLGESGWRVTLADDWSLAGPHPDGSYTVLLKTVMDYQSRNLDRDPSPADGKGDRLRPAADTAPGFTAIRAEGLSGPVNLEKLIGQAEEARRSRELTFTEAMSFVADQGPEGAAAARRGGELLGRALLCLIAALFGLAAVIVARKGVAFFAALPLAAVGTLGFDMLSRSLLGQAAQQGQGQLLLAAGVATAACALPLTAFLMSRGERIVMPAFGRV